MAFATVRRSPTMLTILPLVLLAAVCLFPSSVECMVRHYKFNVVLANTTRLCSTKPIVTVNGQYPGPTLVAREDDTVLVKVVNHVQYNMSIHWHGVRQLRTGWADGPAYITQCPLQPGQTYLYNFTLTGQRGTLLWHAHILWLRATVHGAIVILPKREHTLVLGEWWKSDVEDVINEALKSGAAPNISDAHTIRLNEELFFKIAGHKLTVVEVDATYTKPFKVDTIVLGPGQTTNVLVTSEQGSGKYQISVSPFMDAPITVDNRTATATLHYTGTQIAAPTSLTAPPPINSTLVARRFTNSLLALNSVEYPANVPLTVDHSLFFTISLGVNPCDTCTGGAQVVADFNNVTFVMPKVGLLQAHYFNTKGVFTDDFPANPPETFNYTGSPLPSSLATTNGTRLYRLAFNDTVQLVLQNTALITPENHPIHLHGFNFFEVGRGVGNFNPKKDPMRFNLHDPVERNTVGVPAGGWTAIRFRADNPGKSAFDLF
ncbi:IRX12 [Linum perenne]